MTSEEEIKYFVYVRTITAYTDHEYTHLQELYTEKYNEKFMHCINCFNSFENAEKWVIFNGENITKSHDCPIILCIIQYDSSEFGEDSYFGLDNYFSPVENVYVFSKQSYITLCTDIFIFWSHQHANYEQELYYKEGDVIVRKCPKKMIRLLRKSDQIEMFNPQENIGMSDHSSDEDNSKYKYCKYEEKPKAFHYNGVYYQNKYYKKVCEFLISEM